MISQYKENAKISLKGNWGNAIIVFLGIYFLGGLISSIPQYFVLPTMTAQLEQLENMQTFEWNKFIEIFAASFGVYIILIVVISIFVISILQLGYQRFSIKLAKEDKADPDCIFDGFKNHYWTNVKAMLWVGLYSFLWQIPSLFFYGLGGYFAYQESETSIVFVLLGAVASIFAVVKILSYSLVPYLLMDDTVSFQTGNEYVTESKRVMKGNVLELIFLGLSFILWLFFIIITFGFGILYLGPYMNQAYTNFYLHHKEVKNIAYQ